MTGSAENSLITVNPDELRFQIELEKQTFCDLKVINNTENYVALKVKTTSPKKYFVRPNIAVIPPMDSCIIRVTLQPLLEYPPGMQCKDKFLLQSTIVESNTDVDELPPDTFNKDSGNSIEDLKLRVVYLSQGGADDAAHSSETVKRLKEERDVAAKQTRQLQHELDMLKRRSNQRSDPGFSFTFAMFVGLVGLLFGLLMKLSLSSPPTE